MSARQVVTGEINFGPDARAFSQATVYVWLEDISNVDAPARAVAEQVFHSVAYMPENPPVLRFDLSGRVNRRASYSIRVHVDVDRDGRVSRGDYITMTNYPVLTFGHPRQVVVSVRKV